MPTWIADDACLLPAADRAARLAAFDDLFAAAVRSVERLEPTRLRLGLSPDPAVAARAADLSLREADCCGFFTFQLTAGTGRLELDIAVPEHRAGVLDGIAAQAEAARTSS
ncbi:hypothetical protein GFD30_08230 [Glycomyces sp. NEAU-7082]|uniref:Arsenate reductase n=1 Tax=Glycomyces albidus TaxID=2656774 RepID=A0A6L5G7D5_9ACTN|nr:hypothetical protein [Glycomyces albidus]